jgi:DNA-directed RNA polymerase beta' subunit
MISAQSSKTNITIVQDSLLGAYKMTLGEQKITREEFFQLSMKIQDINEGYNRVSSKKKKSGDCQFDILGKIEHIRGVLKGLGKPWEGNEVFTGKALFSMILPNDFIYKKKNNTDPNEPVVKIYRGVLYEGTINKAIIGGAHKSLTALLYKEYSEETACNFVDNIQFIACEWLLLRGFSVGIDDCIATRREEIDSAVMKCFIEAQGVEETTHHPGIREARVNMALNNARNIGMRMANEALKSTNNFLSTVGSGSKGDFFNLSQIGGVLGQQNVAGKRAPKVFNRGKRTLVNYPFDITDKTTEFESRGFVNNSFIHGINPKEFWFHAAAGREGITDTAMKTADTGYIQRKMVKVMEDLCVKYDGTVRNSTGSIIQLCYGEDGIDGSKTVVINNEPQCCDVVRLAARLNLKHELQVQREVKPVQKRRGRPRKIQPKQQIPKPKPKPQPRRRVPAKKKESLFKKRLEQRTSLEE